MKLASKIKRFLKNSMDCLRCFQRCIVGFALRRASGLLKMAVDVSLLKRWYIDCERRRRDVVSVGDSGVGDSAVFYG